MANVLDCIFCHCGPTTVRPPATSAFTPDWPYRFVNWQTNPSPLDSVAAFCCGRGTDHLQQHHEPALRCDVQNGHPRQRCWGCCEASPLIGSPRDALLVFSAVPLALTGGIIAPWL